MQDDPVNKPFSSSAPPRIPEHEMLKLVGSGGYGEVWLARDTMGNYRAVKVVYRSRFSEDRPFRREFDGIRRFEPVSRHPNQMIILQVGRREEDGFFYYVMEVADDQESGQKINPVTYAPRTLRSHLKQRGRLPFKDCIKIGLELTEALEHLHAKGLVHRDIKPSNVIFVDGRPKLADIGLVGDAKEKPSLVGTEGYIAPEGLSDERADLYALGKVFYEMFTGLGLDRWPDLPEEWADAPNREMQEFREVVNRACEGRRELRYKTAAQLREDLELLKSEKSLVLRRALRSARRLSATLAAILPLGVLVTVILVYRGRAVEENQRRELKEIRIARTGFRHVSGWFNDSWPRLKRAAVTRKRPEVLEEASAMLGGLDATPVSITWDCQGTSAAFSNDGRALVGGTDHEPALLISHSGVVTELPVRGKGPVAWDPDGVPLQAVIVSNNLCLLDARDGRVRREFGSLGRESSGCQLAIASNCSGVAAAVGGELKVWSATSGDQTGHIPLEVSKLEFSPDGSLLAAGCPDGFVRVFSLPGFSPIMSLSPTRRNNPVKALAFGRDPVVHYKKGDRDRAYAWQLAVSDASTEIVIWSLARQMPLSFCRGANWNVQSLAFDPEGLTLAAAGRQEPVLWDAMTGKLLLRLQGGSGSDSTALAFDRTGTRMIHGSIASSSQAAIALWELETARGISCFRGLESPIRQIWFSKETRLVAVLSDDWRLGIWEVGSGHLRFILEVPIGVFADNGAGCFMNDGSQFAFATWHGACDYELREGNIIQHWELPDGYWDQLQFDDNRRLLLLRRESATARNRRIWRLRELNKDGTVSLLSEQTNSDWSTYGLAFAPGGKRFLAWDAADNLGNHVISGYESPTGKELWHAKWHKQTGGLILRVDPRGQKFAWMDNDQTSRGLRLMSFVDFSAVGSIPIDYAALGPSAQGFRNNGWITTAAQEGPCITDWTRNYVSQFSPDGKYLAYGTEEGTFVLVDIAVLGEHLAELAHWVRGHSE